jgi:hypothetical protein
MITSFGTLIPLVVETDCGTKVVFLDASDDSVYEPSGELVDAATSTEITALVRGHRESAMPFLPEESIREVAAADRSLSEEGKKVMTSRGIHA